MIGGILACCGEEAKVPPHLSNKQVQSLIGPSCKWYSGYLLYAGFREHLRFSVDRSIRESVRDVCYHLTSVNINTCRYIPKIASLINPVLVQDASFSFHCIFSLGVCSKSMRCWRGREPRGFCFRHHRWRECYAGISLEYHAVEGMVGGRCCQSHCS